MIQIQPPSVDLVASYLDSIAEMRTLCEKIWESIIPRDSETAEDFVNRLKEAEYKPEPGHVPESTYWGVHNHKVVGRIALRHFLTEDLRAFGGHIGYEVRPSARRLGVATEMLRLILNTQKAREIGRLLLTCAPDNTGSNRAILANKGVFEKTEFNQKWNRETNYYWIDLSKPSS